MDHSVLQTINKPWNPADFAVPRTPIFVGEVENKPSFSTVGVPRVLDMPIKFPGSQIRLPSELNQFAPVIERILGFEMAVNYRFDEIYAYLTIDQKQVSAGNTHRNGGPHVDGIQGREYPVKLAADHSYLVADRDPTIFYTHPFDLSRFDVDTHNFNIVFAEQADPSMTMSPKPYEIYMMDAYTVHESPPLTSGGFRTLLRLEFSDKIYDRLGNTHNPAFDYAWEMRPRPVPEDLQ